jgi:hypothetical protein
MTIFLWCLLWLAIVGLTILSIIVVKRKSHTAKDASTTTSSTPHPPSTPPPANRGVEHNNAPRDNDREGGSRFFNAVPTIVGLVLLVVLAFLCLRLRGWWETPSPRQQTAQHQQSSEEPLRSCLTPCSMYVGWGQRTVWADGNPLKIKYQGLDWVEYPGEKGVFVKLSAEFQPGEAQFVSPKDQHLLVQVYAH